VRGRLPISILVLAVAWSASAQTDPQPAPETPGVDPIARYLADLEASRRLPPEEATEAILRERLRSADDQLVRGDARAATTLLFGVVESPRFAQWKETASYQNAEFLLGRALARGGARRSAERYLVRVLGHGPDGPYFVPAFRALVDLSLETKTYPRMGQVLAAAAPSLPADSQSELAYLRGRTAYDARDFEKASASFTIVDRRSRFYPGAAYFRGLIASRQRQWGEARAAFCEIVDQKDKGKLSFAVDARYFGLKDLARLALGRISHEQDQYDAAYYYYFSLPDESEYLAEALYEASWSMFQKGELDAARNFIDQFERLFPRSPLRAEVAILRANLDVRSCAFDRARTGANKVIDTYRPMLKDIDKLLVDAHRRPELIDRLMARPAVLGTASDHDGEILTLLKLDGRFKTLHQMINDIDADLAEATVSIALWKALGAEAQSKKNLLGATSSPEAAQLYQEVEALTDDALADGVVPQRLADLLLNVSLLTHPTTTAGPYQAEAQAAEAQARQLSALRGRVLEAARGLAGDSLGELNRRLRAILRQARLVQIDGAVGKKKRLEIEIARLYEGKIPAELFHKLQTEGTLADDEEYWPFEGEYWSDEYTKFK
jgi:tetratricopeptide (TPR) repeat protein